MRHSAVFYMIPCGFIEYDVFSGFTSMQWSQDRELLYQPPMNSGARIGPALPDGYMSVLSVAKHTCEYRKASLSASSADRALIVSIRSNPKGKLKDTRSPCRSGGNIAQSC